jgi:hypothetical protein
MAVANDVGMLVAGIFCSAIGTNNIRRKRAAFFDDGQEGFEVTGGYGTASGIAGLAFGLLLIVCAAGDYFGIVSITPLFQYVTRILQMGD